ncbi:MAG TPA: hypothetical protein VKB78_14605 [Pirellulales bacterium]|nr:hypothetical protein [Pirellulales bacterium]
MPAQGKTLFEMVMAKLAGPPEKHIYNPCGAKVGSPVTIDALDLGDANFFIREIRQNRRMIEGREFLFVDYVLLARALEGAETLVRLRLNTVDDPDRVAGLTHNALVLRLYDEMAYNEDLHKVVTDDTKKFQVLENGQVTEEFFRINDVLGSYKTEVTILQDLDHDHQAAAGEVTREQFEYWDYWREIKDEAGQPLTEFLFVETNSSNGWFQLWRGREVDMQKVTVY